MKVKYYFGFIILLVLAIAVLTFFHFKSDDDIINNGGDLVQKSYSAEDLKGQNIENETDRQVNKFYKKRQLFQKLPYTDGYIYISTTTGPQKLLVQYKTTLSDANHQYLTLLKKLGDDPRHYQATFRRVNELRLLN